jgi:hypothetical protein
MPKSLLESVLVFMKITQTHDQNVKKKIETGKCFRRKLNYPWHVCLPFVNKITLLETTRRQITGGLAKDDWAYCTW